VVVLEAVAVAVPQQATMLVVLVGRMKLSRN
jgi:hypothetical protein